jgi:UDP-GlcNAc:undecaprenyl-phosphate GlcNAc-1-phosphate transferase
VSFPFNIYLLAIVGAWTAAFLSFPLWRLLCARIGLIDDPGHRKIHDQPIPLAGGLAVISGMLLPSILAVIVIGTGLADSLLREAGGALQKPGTGISTLSALEYGISRRSLQLAAIFAGAIGILFVGLLDDKYELSPRIKFSGQFFVALLVAAAGVRITLFVPSVLFSYLITILWILTVINAFNFMDNMNGLCAGLGAIAAWYFALMAAIAGQYLVAVTAFLSFGALLGFLPYNFPKARGFLGDSGSHLVGYVLSIMAILPHFHTTDSPRHWAVLIPLFVLAVPLFDMAWVVILRWRIGQPFYQGDTNHLSHRLVRSGYTKTTAVLLIWLAAAAVGALIVIPSTTG